MTTALLQTKLYIPPARPELVQRSRLIEQLKDGLQRPVTLVSAPAGFGKTTLISEWLHQIESPVAWLSLDAGDNDLARFLAYLVGALQRVMPEIGRTVQAMLQAPQLPPLETLMTELINELATCRTSFVCILDDYHVITAQPIHGVLSFLLDNQPPQMHLALTSRADPPLQIAQLRARRQLNEFREVDLRFTIEETAFFLGDVMGLPISEDLLQALEARTEGWIAGLQLAALSMQGRNDIAGFMHGFTGSHRYILDYLTDEVLEQQPQELKAFLLHTSILTRLCAPLCDAILAERQETMASSQQLLERIDNANLFIVPLDDARQWYRYHHLFGNLLQHYLQQQLGQKEINDLHRRASQWYGQHGFPDEALEHAIASADDVRILAQFEQRFWSTMKQGDVNTIVRWLNKLPEAFIYSQPSLSVFSAWTLLASLRINEVDAYIENADQLTQPVRENVQAQTEKERHLLGQIDAIKAFLVRVRGNATEAIELYQKAETYLGGERDVVRGIVLVDLGRAYRLIDDLENARQVLLKAIALNQSIDYMQMVLYATSLLGELEVSQGHSRDAAVRYQAILQTIEAQESYVPPVAADIYASLAQLYRERNELEGARYYAQKAVTLAKQRNFADGLFQAHLALGQIAEAEGDFGIALENFQEAERVIRRSQTTQWIVSVTAYQARLWVRHYQIDQEEAQLHSALTWAHQSTLLDNWRQQVATTFLPSHPPDFTHLTLARILTALGQIEETLALLDWLHSRAAAAGRTRSLVEILLLRAISLERQGQRDQALITLEEALILAEPAGYIRLFADEVEPVATLLSAFSHQPSVLTSAYFTQLLAACRKGRQQPQATGPQLAAQTAKQMSNQALIEPLSERELEVLDLIATGSSNRDIADSLIISIGTVKRHVTNIHGKLGVHSRTQAIVRAKEVGILS